MAFSAYFGYFGSAIIYHCRMVEKYSVNFCALMPDHCSGKIQTEFSVLDVTYDGGKFLRLKR